MTQETSAANPTDEQTRSREDSFAPLDDAMSKYRRALQEDREAAQARYGFTLYHSLEADEKVHHLEQAGFEPRDGEDHYNLGCLAAQRGDWAQAVDHFQKALADLPDHYESAFNLALAKERSGKDASADWKTARNLASEEERARIDAHLASGG